MSPTIRFGTIEIRPGARQLLIHGQPATVGARAFDLLLALIERRERLVTKNELLDIVWPQVVIEEANLHVQVSALRKLLGPDVIATIPGRGYQFVAVLEGAEAAARDTSDTSEPTGVRTGERAGKRTDSVPLPANSPAPAGAPTPHAGATAGPMSRAAGNLPAHRPPLFGRQAELSRLLAHVEEHRLVTVLGAAGMGKTVLAMAVAQALSGALSVARERWPDGVWWVELAPVSKPAQLVETVAQALHITLTAGVAGDSALDHLTSVLSPLSLLLVLDNCEHLIDAAGALAERIVTRAPGVRLLATSQEILNIPGEALFKLDPLAVPSEEEAPAQAARRGAMLLFAARARAADARFALTPENAAAVAEICRRLDGLPLAIELAAARVRVLGVQGLRDKLGERFRVLTGGARTAMRRHQTLLAAIAWSHALLSPAEQVVLRRLGVFVGGFALELAQAVAQDDQLDAWAVLDALSALVDKSLVIADAAEPPRYRLLETTRAYALEKLAAAGETDAWIERHARAVCEFFERAEEARYGEQGDLSSEAFSQRATPELDNGRAALAWATGNPGTMDLAVGLAGAMAPALKDLALLMEAYDALLRLYTRLDDTVQPVRAARLGAWLFDLGRHTRSLSSPQVQEAVVRAERFYQAQAMPRRLYRALFGKGMILLYTGQLRAAQDLLPAMRRLETPSWPAWLTSDLLLTLQGGIYQMQGQYEQAHETFSAQRAHLQSLAGARRGLISSENNLCGNLYLLGRYEECIALAQSVLAREAGRPAATLPYMTVVLMLAQINARHLDDARKTLALALPSWRRHGRTFVAAGVMAMLCAELGLWADAARLGGASAASRRANTRWQDPRYSHEIARFQALLAAAPCPAADIERWLAEGRQLDEAAIAAIGQRVAAQPA